MFKDLKEAKDTIKQQLFEVINSKPVCFHSALLTIKNQKGKTLYQKSLKLRPYCLKMIFTSIYPSTETEPLNLSVEKAYPTDTAAKDNLRDIAYKHCETLHGFDIIQVNIVRMNDETSIASFCDQY